MFRSLPKQAILTLFVSGILTGQLHAAPPPTTPGPLGFIVGTESIQTCGEGDLMEYPNRKFPAQQFIHHRRAL